MDVPRKLGELNVKEFRFLGGAPKLCISVFLPGLQRANQIYRRTFAFDREVAERSIQKHAIEVEAARMDLSEKVRDFGRAFRGRSGDE